MDVEQQEAAVKRLLATVESARNLDAAVNQVKARQQQLLGQDTVAKPGVERKLNLP